MGAVINDYISRERVRDAALLPLGNPTTLLQTGIPDSLSMLSLVVFLQDRSGVVVDDTICGYLRSRAGEGAGQAGGRG